MALCGVVTPMLTACYVMWWRAGGEGTFCILPRQIWETLTQPHEGSWGVEGIELGGSTPAIWVAGGIGFLIVCALVSGMADFRRRGKKVQSILSYNTILFFATLGVLYLNRDIARMMPSIALSAAILMPQFLLKLKQKTLAAAFLLLICGFIAVLFVKV